MSAERFLATRTRQGMTRIYCDNGCRHAIDADDAKGGREVAKALGWARRDGRDLCPRCAEGGAK